MQKRSKLLGILGLLITAAVLGAVSQTAEDLFQKALRLETNEGKMMEAIGLYRSLLKQFPDNRQMAAEAQFRIGLCYERLGNQEAHNAYQAVLQDFADQKEVVAKARDRLSRLARPSESPDEPEGIQVKQVWKKKYLDSLGSVSPDGRFLAFGDWGEGNLAIHDLATGANRILPRGPGTAEGFVQEPLFSRDGKQIAYSWWNPYHTYDLFLVDVDDPKPRRLYRKEGEHVYPATWLSDDTLVFTSLNYATRLFQVCSLNIPSGTIRVLKSLHGGGGRYCASPDGMFIAYAFSDETDKGNSDINLLAMDGSGEIPLVKHPADDKVIGWVPGRKEFLFTSDRSGTRDLWAVLVEEGKATGPAKRVFTDLGAVGPVGFSRNGDCFVGFSRRNFNTLLAPFDPATGELHERAGRALLGSNYGIEWSPDGLYLSYIGMQRSAGNPMQLIVQNAETGDEHVLADHLYLFQAPRWSPDGKSLLVIGGDRDRIGAASTKGYKGGVFDLDVKTGQTTEILELSDYEYPIPDDDAFPLSDVEWSLDGKSIFYLFFTDRLVRRDLATGKETILYQDPRFERGVLRLSPGGKMLLFATRIPDERRSRLLTIPVDGGKDKELCASRESARLMTALWSPDGNHVYYVERDDDGTSLWRVPAAGGSPEKTWQSKERAEIFGIHPKGNQISIALYVAELEIRVIKNLARELEKLF